MLCAPRQLRGEPAAGRRHNHCFSSGLLAGNKKSLVKRHNAMVDMFGSAEFAHLPETFELPYQARLPRAP